MQNKKKLVIAVGRRYGIRLVDSEFDLKGIYDFIELFIPPRGEYARDKDRARVLHDFEIECAKIILEKLRSREVVCDADFYIIITYAARNIGLIDSSECKELLDIFESGRYSKTYYEQEVLRAARTHVGNRGKNIV